MFTRRHFLGCALAGISCTAIPKNIFIPGRNNASLRILYLTDLHASEEAYVESAYGRIFDAIKKEKFDLILGGGDWITEGNFLSIEQAAKRFKRFGNFWSALPGKKVLIPGNHDFVRSMPEALPELTLFESNFGPTNTSVDLGGAQLITLQSLQFSTDKTMPYIGEVSASQLEWLKAELNKINFEMPIILLLHLPLVTMLYQQSEGATAQAPKNRVVTNNLEVLNVFKHRNLSLVLQGHLHVSEFMKWNDTTFITGGALCGRWWQGDNHGTPAGFGVVSLEPKGVEWNYKTY